MKIKRRAGFSATNAVGTTATQAQPVKNQTLVPAPSGVFLDSYHEHQVVTYGPTPAAETNVWVVTQDWTNAIGGYGNTVVNGETEVEDFWPEVAWPQWASAEGESAGVVEWDEDGIGNIWNISTNTGELYPLTLGEHCDVNWYYPAPEFDWQQRTADTEYKLATGGPPGSKQQNLWVISATAWAHTNVVDGYGTPVPPQQIQIGSFGNLDTNGNLYVVLPDNDPDNVTPKVNGDDKYTFTVTAQKYTLVATANSQWLGNGFTPNPQFCVGQPVSFSPSWIPYAPPYLDAVEHWTLPGTFVNTNSDPNCDLFYSEDATQLNRVQSQDHTLATSCWYVDKLQNGSAKVTMLVVLNDGRQVPLQASGTFDILRPTTTFISPSSLDGTPTVIVTNGVLSLGDGNRDNDMSFGHQINPGSFSGNAGYTQLIFGEYTESSSGLPIGISTNGFVLDNQEFPRGINLISANTNSTVTFWDGPADGLYQGNAQENLQFSSYLMFRPSGGIWVPLRLVTWELQDEAANGAFFSGNVTGPTNSDCTSFPHWENKFSNSGF